MMGNASPSFRRYLLASSAMIAVYAVTATTLAAASLDVVTSVRDDYARILFNWDQQVRIKPSANGRELTITFDEPSDVPLERITGSLDAYILGARQSSDKRQIILDMRDAYPVRNFVSGNSNGIDMLFNGVRPAPQREVLLTPQTTATVNGQPVIMPGVPIGQEVLNNVAAPVAASNPPAVPSQHLLTTKKQGEPVSPLLSTKPLAATAPKPDKAELAKQIAAIPVPKPASDVMTTKKKVEPETIAVQKPQSGSIEQRGTLTEKKPETTVSAETSNKTVTKPATDKLSPKAVLAEKAEVPKVTASALEKDKPEAKAVVNTKQTDKQPDDKQAETAKPVSGKPMLVALEKNRLSTKFFLPFEHRTAVASFQRGRDVFMVFNDPVAVDIEKIRTILPNYIAGIEQLKADNATILRVMMNGEAYTKATQTGKGYEWVVEVSRRSQTPKNLTIPQLINTPPVKPYIGFDVLQMADPIQFLHPVTGEQITTIPSYEGNRGVYPERQLSEVIILRTGQGIAYIPQDDDIMLRKLRQGIRITAMNGMAVTPDMPPIPEETIKVAEAGSHTFFPYKEWKVDDLPAFRAREQMLLKEISLADDMKVPVYRLDLAELYMSEGMYMEALVLLRMIKQDSPAFYDDNQLAAVNGGAHFMVGRNGAAAQFFTDDAVVDEEETRLWKRLMEIVMGERKNFDYQAYYKQYIQNYPPDMKRRIALVAADNALAQKRPKMVVSILNQLAKDGLLEPVQGQADYMLGRILAEEGNIEAAESYLKPLIENPDNNFLRARAGFTLATAKYRQGLIDRPQLIAELEPLRILWRGDAFELNLLNLMGELYVNNSQPIEGLRAWRDVVTYFPESATALDASGRMAEAFVNLFNNGEADKLTPLEALALYYEFRELTPLGREGDVMIQNLADRLAGVDLLERAASLLEHQVTFRLEKEDRSRVGARLALIHLLNREPAKTLEVLELTGYGGNNEQLMRERNHLAAMSYAKLGKWRRAVNTLRDDYSREAKFIRTDIYWDNRDWDNLAMTVEDILATRSDIAAPLDENETTALLRLAVAYAFKEEPDQLQYLRDYFMPLVASADRKETFDFLTSGINPVNRDNVTRLTEEMNKMKSFLDNYRISLGEKGLSSSFN